MNKLVSIIIPCRNEEQFIGRLLVSITTQTYPNVEIAVVDNNSSDNTKRIAKKFTDKIYNFGPERSAQRNFGAKKARGEYLLFLDADMELTSDVILECVDLMDKDIKGIVIPEQSLANNFWGKVKVFERSFYNETGDETTDAARFFDKKIFRKTGGYDTDITGPEDWDLPENIKKLGYKIGRIKAKIYHHERISNPLSLAKKKFYYGLSSYKYLQKHNIGVISPKTIYFLRPVFYKNWRKLLAHPILMFAMFFMFILELFGGGLGYLVGRLRR